jgi:hypothetical protein
MKAGPPTLYSKGKLRLRYGFRVLLFRYHHYHYLHMSLPRANGVLLYCGAAFLSYAHHNEEAAHGVFGLLLVVLRPTWGTAKSEDESTPWTFPSSSWGKLRA